MKKSARVCLGMCAYVCNLFGLAPLPHHSELGEVIALCTGELCKSVGAMDASESWVFSIRQKCSGCLEKANLENLIVIN